MTHTAAPPLIPIKLVGGTLGFNWLPVLVTHDRDISKRYSELSQLSSVDKAGLLDSIAQDSAHRGWSGRWVQRAARVMRAWGAE
jgi:sugar lactone lactonase YvrE